MEFTEQKYVIRCKPLPKANNAEYEYVSSPVPPYFHKYMNFAMEFRAIVEATEWLKFHPDVENYCERDSIHLCEREILVREKPIEE